MGRLTPFKRLGTAERDVLSVKFNSMARAAKPELGGMLFRRLGLSGRALQTGKALLGH